MMPNDPNPNPTPAPAAKPGEPAPSPAPSPSPAPAPVTDWRDSIQDAALKEHAKRFTDVAALVSANLDQHKRLSASIRVPGKDAKPEEIVEYRKRIGVPETPDAYKFELPNGREATDADKAFQKAMAETFHAVNITAEQAAALNKKWNDHVVTSVKAVQDADKAYAERTQAELKTKWGADYDTNVTFSKRAAQTIFAEDYDAARALEDKSGRFIFDNPIMLKAFAKLGREMGEDGLRGGAMSDGDRATLKEQIRKLDDEFYTAYHRSDRIRAQELDARRAALYAKLPGGGAIVGSEGRTL